MVDILYFFLTKILIIFVIKVVFPVFFSPTIPIENGFFFHFLALIIWSANSRSSGVFILKNGSLGEIKFTA